MCVFVCAHTVKLSESVHSYIMLSGHVQSHLNNGMTVCNCELAIVLCTVK